MFIALMTNRGQNLMRNCEDLDNAHDIAWVIHSQ